jgi:hypothetical protein
LLIAWFLVHVNSKKGSMFLRKHTSSGLLGSDY